jgi:hypothetical protein
LLECGNDVLRTVVVVLVQGVMLHGRAHKPCPLGSFDKHTTTGGYSLAILSVQIVISSPTPHILNVGGGCAGEMNQAPGRLALIGTATTVCFDFATSSTADTEVGVPETDIAGARASDVYFDLNKKSIWDSY